MYKVLYIYLFNDVFNYVMVSQLFDIWTSIFVLYSV